MIALIRLLLALLPAPFQAKLALEAENAALRQQIIVLLRKRRGRVKLSNADRLFFIWLYRLFPVDLPSDADHSPRHACPVA